MNYFKKIFYVLTILLGVLPISAQAAFPDKSIHFVVPYAPGGPLDAIARLLGEKVQTDLNQVVIVENKAGAGGNIGINGVLKSKPDGYTIGMGAVATMAINPWLYSNIPFNAETDFAPIILLANVPNVLIINQEFAHKHQISSASELFKFIKQHQGELNYASGGTGSAGHLAGELLKSKLGLEIVHVPYQGAGPAKLSLLADQTQLMFDNLASAQALIKAKQVVALAVSTNERSNFLPEVPTLKELGVDGIDITTWFGVVAPAGTPAETIDTLHQSYAKAMQDPAVKKQLQMMGSDLSPTSSEAFRQFAKQEYEKYKTIVKLSGAVVN